jgi:hypothetical protein
MVQRAARPVGRRVAEAVRRCDQLDERVHDAVTVKASGTRDLADPEDCGAGLLPYDTFQREHGPAAGDRGPGMTRGCSCTNPRSGQPSCGRIRRPGCSSRRAGEGAHAGPGRYDRLRYEAEIYAWILAHSPHFPHEDDMLRVAAVVGLAGPSVVLVLGPLSSDSGLRHPIGRGEGAFMRHGMEQVPSCARLGAA